MEAEKRLSIQRIESRERSQNIQNRIQAMPNVHAHGGDGQLPDLIHFVAVRPPSMIHTILGPFNLGPCRSGSM